MEFTIYDSYNPKRKDHLLSVYWRGLVVNDEKVKVPVAKCSRLC